MAENPRTAIVMPPAISIMNPERRNPIIALECWYIADTLYCIMAERYISLEGQRRGFIPCVVKTTKKPAMAWIAPEGWPIRVQLAEEMVAYGNKRTSGELSVSNTGDSIHNLTAAIVINKRSARHFGNQKLTTPEGKLENRNAILVLLFPFFGDRAQAYHKRSWKSRVQTEHTYYRWQKRTHIGTKSPIYLAWRLNW